MINRITALVCVIYQHTNEPQTYRDCPRRSSPGQTSGRNQLHMLSCTNSNTTLCYLCIQLLNTNIHASTAPRGYNGIAMYWERRNSRERRDDRERDVTRRQ